MFRRIQETMELLIVYLKNTGFRVTRIQKYLLIVLTILMIGVSAKIGYNMVGHRIFGYTVERWMVLSETAQQALLFPFWGCMIMKLPEEP